MTELCIMVAPNGARRTKADHPKLPITPAELAQTASACYAAGAGAIHLHVRDSELRHSLDSDAYRAAVTAVQTAVPDIAIQVTTEAAGVFTLRQQIDCVTRLQPPCVSFSIAELMRDGAEIAAAFLEQTNAAGIALQFILYSPEDIQLFARLMQDNLFPLPKVPRVILVVGRYAGSQNATVDEFDALYGAVASVGLEQRCLWMTCAFGTGELACLERTIALGGHVRVGFENAIVNADGSLAVDNAARVAAVAEMARAHGRVPMNGASARRFLGASVRRALI